MKPKSIYLILFAACLLTACIKDQPIINRTDLLIGTWASDKYTFVINDYTGRPDPFCVTKKDDSLHVFLYPDIDLNYKILSVNSTYLTVSDKNEVDTYKRIENPITQR